MKFNYFVKFVTTLSQKFIAYKISTKQSK